jgi:hypothetical protein
MDKRALNKGTKGNNGGRPSKAEEHNLIEKLSPLEPLAFSALTDALENKKDWAVKLFFEYMFGKPKQQTDITSMGEKIQNVINLGAGINPEDETSN